MCKKKTKQQTSNEQIIKKRMIRKEREIKVNSLLITITVEMVVH